jgi:hypothetical protein
MEADKRLDKRSAVEVDASGALSACGADAGPARRGASRGRRRGDCRHYPGRGDVPEGYELGVFAANGQTIAVVSIPASAVREATEREVLSVREMGVGLRTLPLLGANRAEAFRSLCQLTPPQIRIAWAESSGVGASSSVRILPEEPIPR